MKKRWRRVIGVVAVLVLVGLLVDRIGMVCAPEGTYDDLRNIRAFHSLPKDSVEVIIYGSSHPWNGVNPVNLYENYGIGAYNYSAHWQAINTTALFVDDSLKTQSPKIAIIDTVRVDRILEDTPLDGEVFYTRELPASKEKWAYLRRCFGWKLENYLSYFVPLWAFHDNWTEINRQSFKQEDAIADSLKTMGALLNDDKAKSVEIKDSSAAQKKLKQSTVEILDGMVEKLHEAGASVIFITMPISRAYNYSDAMRKYAAEKGCDYVNLLEHLDEIGLDVNSDFKNEGHMNRQGAEKVSAFLGKYISEHYDYTDMRTVEGNIWEKAFEK